jgi:hypothetical protein
VQILAIALEKRKPIGIKARWPISIITNSCLIEGESRNITANGMLARFKEQLQENETYRMIITLPQNRYLAVKGKVIWSNLEGIDHNGTFSDMAFYFVQLPEEDLVVFNHAVSAQHT